MIQIPLSLLFAIPDHPWVDTVEGAAVRIAMTVAVAGTATGELRTVTGEEPHEDGSSLVTFAVLNGRIAADLTGGADASRNMPLKANVGLALRGMTLVGEGFFLSKEEAGRFGLGKTDGIETVIRLYISGSDLTTAPRERHVIDLFGLSADETRTRFPDVYQRVLTRVKPEREQNKRASYREKWWIFAEPRPEFREAVANLRRYIGTSMTAKHRTFTFLPTSSLPDQGLIALPLEDAFHLGVLSSRIHVVFALAAGGRLGVGNDPRYNNSVCFDPYPFPACDEAAKARIRALGEELDAHRKRVQAQHPGLSLTAMYNVLEALREGRPLSKKEQDIHDRGLVSVLRQLHDELDAAVAAAYGWQDLWEWHDEARKGSLHDFKTGMDAQLAATGPEYTAALATWEREFDGEILTRLVALNAARAAEEAAGKIRWLRPDYQAPAVSQPTLGITANPAKGAKPAKKKAAKAPWPKPLAERVKATEQALREAATAVTPAELAKRFLRAKPEDLAEILETLVSMSRAHQDGEKFSV